MPLCVPLFHLRPETESLDSGVVVSKRVREPRRLAYTATGDSCTSDLKHAKVLNIGRCPTEKDIRTSVLSVL